MNAVAIVMVIFSMLGALDRIFGNRFGLGKEFEKGLHMMGIMLLSMAGMIIISPAIADLLEPCFDWTYRVFQIDPSVIPGILFANDMGGAPLAKEIAKDPTLGLFNGLVVGSMMGATVSFTIPYALGCIKKEQHGDLMLGLLCGIVTIPLGCFAAGLCCKIPVPTLLLNLLPLALFAGLIALGLFLIPKICVKIFQILGTAIKILITLGLALGILKFLTGLEPIPGLTTIEEAGGVCLNAAIVMSGAFPLLLVLSKVLKKPLQLLGKLLGINETSALGFLANLGSNANTFELMGRMDQKGTVLNSSFAVSAAFMFAGHLAFTLAFDASFLPYVLIGKAIAGITALFFAALIYKRTQKNT